MNVNRMICVILLTFFVSGCSFIPGSDITRQDVTLNDQNKSANPKIDFQVYPLTSQTIGKYENVNKPMVKTNSELNARISDYDYKVGSGDVLSVTVWDHPELTIPAGSYRSAVESGTWVHSDGTIFYPYIGRISVINKTVTDIRLEISQLLSKYIKNPQVDVSVASFRSKRVYITGEVNKPGQQAITNVPLTLLDAVNNAGGLSADADWQHVTLTHNGHEKSLSLYGLMQRGDLSQNALLENGDIVHVSRNDAQKVFILGDVSAPQLLTIDRYGMSLTEALSRAGGIKEISADATGVFVIRASKDSTKEFKAKVFQLNVQNATALVIGAEFELKPKDVVYVTTAAISRWNRVISLLLPTVNVTGN